MCLLRRTSLIVTLAGLVLGLSRLSAAAVPLIAVLLSCLGSSALAAESVKEHVDLKLTKKTGASKFQHKGRASGTFDGAVRSTLTIEHSVVLRGTGTIKTSRGSVRFKIDGRARSLSLRTKFSGTVTITGGTGQYAHAKGAARFSGVVNRRTWHATLDATGSFTS